MSGFIRRRWPDLLLAMLTIVAVFAAVIVFPMWKTAVDRGGQQPAEPFRIAGNLYYVGMSDVAVFLLTGPAGHVLIGGGFPGTPPLIVASIAKLGFDIRDVKVLLASEPHRDLAGGFRALQEASGAELWVSDADADVVAAGGAGATLLGPLSFVSDLPLFRYPAPRVDHRFKDGATIQLGPVEVTAHVTAGSSPGCTSWSFPVRDSGRDLLAVRVCNLGPPPALSMGEYPEIRAGFERSFVTLRSLPADIFLTAHARGFGRYRKFLERATAKEPADPFIDRDGYLRYIDSAEKSFREAIGERR